MIEKIKKIRAVQIPLIFSLLIMFGTLFVFLWGPIPWITTWDWAAWVTVLLLILYFVAFAIGYLFCVRKSEKIEDKEKPLIDVEKVERLLKVTIYISFVLTIANAFLYSGASNIVELFQKMVVGLTDPDTAYFSKDASSRMGSVVVWITFFYSPILYLTNVAGLFLFKKLTILQKCCYCATLVVELMRWLAVGTNKGLFDIVLLFLFMYIMMIVMYMGNKEEHTEKNKKTIIYISVGVFAAIVLFFMYFNSAISARVGGAYKKEYFMDFPYNLVPEQLRFFLAKADSYLTQGYANMVKIIRNCEWKWTFGIGNSRFLMDCFERVFGIDMTLRTYPYQLAAYGVDPLASWHSAYAWFASDLSFVGIIPFMFGVGYFMCGLVRDVLKHKDMVALALLYLVFLSIVNASCTNYVLAYTNGFMGFWCLFALRIFKGTIQKIINRWSRKK